MDLSKNNAFSLIWDSKDDYFIIVLKHWQNEVVFLRCFVTFTLLYLHFIHFTLMKSVLFFFLIYKDWK